MSPLGDNAGTVGSAGADAHRSHYFSITLFARMSTPESIGTGPEEASPAEVSGQQGDGLSDRLLRLTRQRGLAWTLVAAWALVVRCIIPEVYPQWFVDASGQISVHLGWVGGLVVAGLLLGRWWMRLLALVYFVVGFIGAIPIANRLLDPQPNFINDHAFGYSLLLLLDAVAFCIIAFVPSVRERFASDRSPERGSDGA